MPKIKRAASPFDVFDDDFDEDASSSSSKNGNPPIQRNAANARERARMRVLSSAFGRLKTKLPNIPPDTKLSKLDTLRLATIYIKQLKTLLEGGDETMDVEPFTFHHPPQSMTWPFTFQHIQATSRQLTPHYVPMEWSQPEKYSNDPYRNHNNNNSSIMNNNHVSNTHNSSSSNSSNHQQHSVSNTIQTHSSCLYEHSSHGHVIH